MSGAFDPARETPPVRSLRFDRFMLDMDDERLSGPEGQLRLGHKAFRVLLVLANAGGRLVTKDALLDQVWNGVHVTESALTSVVKELRRVLGDDPRNPRFISSVYGRGYRFLSPVEPVTAPAAAPALPIRAPAAPERRPLTVLAAGIGAGATLADPEELAAAVGTLAVRCAAIITDHGGTLARPAGQGLLAWFGWPHADEDAAASAVRAGLALRALALPAGLTIGVGIATGTVVISPAAHPDAPPTVIGEAQPLAERLAATGDGVLVNDATRRAADWLALFEPAVPLPGPAGGVPVFAAAGVVRFASRSQASGAGAALFGRDAERDLLRRCWESAATGLGQVALIEAEAGLGKSRLAGAARAEVPGPQVIAWFGRAGADGRALHPVTDWLAREAGLDPVQAAEVQRARLAAWLAMAGMPAAAPALEELLGIAAPGAAGAGADGQRERLLGLIVQLVEKRAARPLLLVVEDLHWLDPSSRDLLDRIVRRAADLPLLVLATTRPGLRPDPRTDWAEQADLVTVTLGLLPADAATRIVEALDSQGQLPPDTVRAIVRRADGVPLFVEELAKSVIEAGEAGADALAAVPATLQDVVAARLDRLGPARDVARIAAAIGRNFPYELIAAVSPLPPAELRQALRELVRAGLVQAQGVPPASDYVFAHALIHDAAHEMLPRRQREALHAQVAEVLRRDFPARAAADPGLLAFHLARAGDAAGAVPHWIAAGQAAAAKAAHLEAVGQFSAARAALADLPATMVGERLQVLIGLAVSLAAARGYSAPEVGEVLAEARGICDALGNAPALFTVLRGLCAFAIVSGDLDGAEALSATCLGIGRDTGEPMQRIEGECPHGYVLWARGRLGGARGHLEAAVALYDAHDGATLPPCTPQDPLIQSLGPLTQLCHAIGDDAAAARWHARLVAHGEALGPTFSQAFGLYWQATFAINAGAFDRALAAAAASLRLCEEQDHVALLPYARSGHELARGLAGQGGRAAAEAAADVIAEAGRRGLIHGLAWNQGQLAALWLALGDVEAAAHWNDTALATVARWGDRYCLSPLLRRRATILSALPGADHGTIAAVLDTAETIAREQGAHRFAAEAVAARRSLGISVAAAAG